jgi:hypothetical protein
MCHAHICLDLLASFHGNYIPTQVKMKSGALYGIVLKVFKFFLHVCDNLCDSLTNTKITYLLWLIMRLDNTLTRRRSENTIIRGNDNNIHVTKLTEKSHKIWGPTQVF